MSERILIAPAATKEWWARIIRWVLRSKYNHVFFLYECKLWGGWWAADIRKQGVQKTPSEDALQRVKFIEYWACSMPLEKGLRKTRKFILSGYDFLGLLANLFRVLLWRITKFRWLKPCHSADKVFCSEYVAMVIALSDIPHSEDLEPAIVSPEAVREFMDGSIYFNQVDNPFAIGGNGGR